MTGVNTVPPRPTVIVSTTNANNGSRIKQAVLIIAFLFVSSLVLFYFNGESIAQLVESNPFVTMIGDSSRPEVQVVERGDDFGIEPDESEVPPTQDVFSNKIQPPPVEYDESNPPSALAFRKNAGIHLITTFFKGSYHKQRINELVEALRRNVNNPLVEAVHVLYEKDNPRTDLEKTNAKANLATKLITVKVPKQPTYFRLFGYANAALERGSIAIVANSDIYFDKTLQNLKFGPPPAALERNDTQWRSAMALSRSHSADCGAKDDWNGVHDLCQTYIGSHDAFVFAPPAPDFVLKNSRHTQNNFGAENIIVFGFIWARGFRGHLGNPCKRVRAMHLHCVDERHYEVGAFISAGRHGNIRPGIKPEREDSWNYIN